MFLILLPRIKKEAKKSFEFSEVNSIKFIGDYESDKLTVKSTGLHKDFLAPIERESETLILSNNENLVSVFKNKIKNRIEYEKIYSFVFEVNFLEKIINYSIKIKTKDGQFFNLKNSEKI